VRKRRVGGGVAKRRPMPLTTVPAPDGPDAWAFPPSRSAIPRAVFQRAAPFGFQIVASDPTSGAVMSDYGVAPGRPMTSLPAAFRHHLHAHAPGTKDAHHL